MHRMKRGTLFIALWLLMEVLLGGVFVPPVPPGGVLWPFYIVVVCIPLGALLYGRCRGNTLVALCYGLLAGLWFGYPIFDNQREVLAGVTTVEVVALKIGLFTVGTALVCLGSFGAGRRLFRPDRGDLASR